MTEPRYTHVVCGQCYQWHPIGPCPAPPAMMDDKWARALLVKILSATSLTVQPVQGDIILHQIASALREERRRAFEEAATIGESVVALLYSASPSHKRGAEEVIAMIRQQAREEETP